MCLSFFLLILLCIKNLTSDGLVCHLLREQYLTEVTRQYKASSLVHIHEGVDINRNKSPVGNGGVGGWGGGLVKRGIFSVPTK